MAARIHHNQFFSKVRVARELLKAKAEEIINEYLDVANKAKDAGDYETAAKSLQWLIEHMPADDDGARVADISVDKPAPVVQQPTGPAIQIGISVGGVGKQQLPQPVEVKELPPAPPEPPPIEAQLIEQPKETVDVNTNPAGNSSGSTSTRSRSRKPRSSTTSTNSSNRKPRKRTAGSPQ